MEPNVRLIESMEAVFASSQARVVIAFEVNPLLTFTEINFGLQVLKEKEGGGRYWNKVRDC